MKPPRLVDVATSGAVVTSTLRIASVPGELGDHAAERLLGGRVPRARPAFPTARATRTLRSARAQVVGVRGPRAGTTCPRVDEGANLTTRRRGTARRLHAKLVDLLRGQQRGMVARVAGRGQAPALDRVGEHHAGPVGDVVTFGEGGEQRDPCRGRRGRAPTRRTARRRTGRGTRQPLPEHPRRKRSRVAEAASPKSDWYCSLGMAIDPARATPRRPAARTRRSWRRPYLTSATCQPAASNCARHWPIRTPGSTRSRDWRLKSTIHITLPRPAVAGSATASQMLPSSSSASPISRDEAGVLVEAPKWASTYRREAAANSGCGRAEPDRAGGEVDAVRVLGPRRIGLQPAEGAQPSSGRTRPGRRAGS